MFCLNRVAASAALLAAAAVPAFAGTTMTPQINSYGVECAMQGGQMKTVKFDIHYQNLGLNGFQFRFRNQSSGQFTDYRIAASTSGLVRFALPQGKYDVTVTVIIPGPPFTQVPNSGALTFNNIVVPKAVSSNGRGLGCMFATTLNPATAAPFGAR
jgi:hypothetical protein